jgi:RNA-binding protein PNO1
MNIDDQIILSPEELNSSQNNNNKNVDAMDEDADSEENNNVDLDAIFNSKPSFPPLTPQLFDDGNKQERRVPIPQHRLTPLKKHWMQIYEPIVKHMKLQIRFNTRTKCVELRTSPHTTDIGALQKSADFVKAFALGFDVNDAIALLRLDDLYIDSFEIGDVKTLHGDHLARAIGRIAGKDGQTKFAIENATKTRIVLADKKVHILGSYQNIKIARDAIVALILGAPPSKVYGKVKTIAARARERF